MAWKMVQYLHLLDPVDLPLKCHRSDRFSRGFFEGTVELSTIILGMLSSYPIPGLIELGLVDTEKIDPSEV